MYQRQVFLYYSLVPESCTLSSALPTTVVSNLYWLPGTAMAKCEANPDSDILPACL